MQLRILVVEDDPNTRAALVEIFASEGHEVTAASDGKQAQCLYQRQAFDLACLDVMIPGVSGYDLCRFIRQRDQDLPILFISAKGEEIDKVVGLELGADDYIVKPFGVKEVTARIRAIARRRYAQHNTDRPQTDLQDDFQMLDLHISPRSLRASRDREVIELSPRDVKILHVLWRTPGQVVNRREISRAAWEQGHQPGSRTLDQTISQLRKRIEHDPANPKIIKTVYGVGYRFDP